MTTRLALLVVLAACGSTPPPKAVEPAAPPAPPAPPAPAPVSTPPADPMVAAPRPVTDTYHGVAVVDPYRWLEADDAAVHAWSTAQDAHARAILDHLPHIDELRREIHDIFAEPITKYWGLQAAGGKLFGFRKQPTHEQPELVAIDDPAKLATVHLIFDPAAAGGAQRAIDWQRPSPDGTRVAVSISEGGSESGALHVLDLDGKDVEPVIPNVQHGTGGGDVAWMPDSKGFYYTRYPGPGERQDGVQDAWMQVWVHRLGTPVARDRYELGKDLPKIAEIQLRADKRGRVIASVQDGDGGTYRHYLHDKAGWRQLDDWSDRVVSVDFGTGDELWVVSRKDAPRGKLLKLAGDAKSTSAGKVILPEGKDAIVTSFLAQASVVANGDRIYVGYQLGGPSELRAFTPAGKPAKAPPIPNIASVGAAVPWKTGIIYDTSSYTTNWAYHYFDPAPGTATELPDLAPKSTVDLSSFEVSREFATSADGTKVPLNIVWPRGAAKDGSTPCMVTGYGGYGFSEEPYFMGGYAPLLRRGVCVVDVNLRGGSEFGEAWHAAGSLTHKQNVFDDFTAALEYMIANKYTSTPKLGILGGSNGGLLMGAIFTQHPELVHVVVSEVGIYDMLRVELSPNGAYNVTEFGTVTDPEQFKALHAYSPYHHVARTAYPAILMTTGANDPRVSPWQSRKMIAALQAAQTGNAPILLRTSDKSGHGIGSSMTERIDLAAHVQAFLLAQLKP